MKTVAVMQPYFLPYAGYFRLFAAADQVALFDCAQFPRRGWVHRNRLPGASGDAGWLTLPLQRAPVTTAIKDLRFAADAASTLQEACRRFPALNNSTDPLLKSLLQPDGSVCDYLEILLRDCCARLDLRFNVVRTSTLDLDPSLRGQDRILAALNALNADRYVNLEGGRALYDPADFEDRGIQLKILPDWTGSTWSILYRLLTEPTDTVAREIHAQL